MARTNRTPTDSDRLKADIGRLNVEDELKAEEAKDAAGRRRDRLADPADSNHFDPALRDDTDQIVVVTAAQLTAAASPRGGEMADPPAAPDRSVSESSPPAGSGGGSGRSLVRDDASEKLLAAAMGVAIPAGDPSYALTHAEESARMVVVAQKVGDMWRALADGRLADDDDVRAVYLKMRQIAATHGLDLTTNGGLRKGGGS